MYIAACNEANGKLIKGRKILVDVERGRTVKDGDREGLEVDWEAVTIQRKMYYKALMTSMAVQVEVVKATEIDAEEVESQGREVKEVVVLVILEGHQSPLGTEMTEMIEVIIGIEIESAMVENTETAGTETEVQEDLTIK